MISDDTKELLLRVARSYVHRWLENEVTEMTDAAINEATKEMHQHLEVAYGMGYLDATPGPDAC